MRLTLVSPSHSITAVFLSIISTSGRVVLGDSDTQEVVVRVGGNTTTLKVEDFSIYAESCYGNGVVVLYDVARSTECDDIERILRGLTEDQRRHSCVIGIMKDNCQRRRTCFELIKEASSRHNVMVIETCSDLTESTDHITRLLDQLCTR